jgi:cytochrome c biogenesis protein ResB
MLGSSRLAVVLLATLLLVSLVASLFPQMPAEESPGSSISTAERDAWLETVSLRYGNGTPLLHAVGVFNAFRSLPFVLLLAALLLNMLLCTLQRLPGLWRSFALAPAVARPEPFYRSLAQRAEWSVPSIQEGLATAQEVLAHRRFSVTVKHSGPTTCAHLYAERGRWAKIAGPVSHIAALLLLTIILARPLLSWREASVVLLPGQVYGLEHEPELSVRTGEPILVESTDHRSAEHRVPLTILAGNSPARTQTVRMNRPLAFQGTAFHLQGTGPAARLTTPESSLDLAFRDVHVQEVALSEAGATVRVAYQPGGETLFVEALAQDGSLLGSGIVADRQELDIQGTPVTLSLSRYSVWQISRQPTFGPAIGLAGLLLVAITISLWVPHQRIWLRVDQHKAQGAAGSATPGFDALMAQIVHRAPKASGVPARPSEESNG